eukprot:Gb_32406 [translate_table: standard]
MGYGSRFGIIALVVVGLAVYIVINRVYGGDRQAIMEGFHDLSEKLGIWAMPLYVIVHTFTLALCLPYAIFFEAGAALLFGFVRGVVCVFSAKILGASLSFCLGRRLVRLEDISSQGHINAQLSAAWVNWDYSKKCGVAILIGAILSPHGKGGALGWGLSVILRNGEMVQYFPFNIIGLHVGETEFDNTQGTHNHWFSLCQKCFRHLSYFEVMTVNLWEHYSTPHMMLGCNGLNALRHFDIILTCHSNSSCYCFTMYARALFKSSSSAMAWVQRNKYFHILSKGLARDGWRFVLLARFSPVPSYVINYALAATDVRFFVDFLVPTIVGCLPMILQNTSIGSLTSAAVVSDAMSWKDQLSSYLFPLLGIVSSLLITLRVKKYSSEIILDASSEAHNSINDQVQNADLTYSARTFSGEGNGEKSGLRKRVSTCSCS